MDPATIAIAINLIKAAIEGAPAIIADYQAMKAAGSITPEQAAVLDVQIDALHAARQLSWQSADAALDAAAKT